MGLEDYFYEEEVEILEGLLGAHTSDRLGSFSTVGGALKFARTEFSNDTTLDPNEAIVWVAKSLSADTTVTLPPAANWSGVILIVKRDYSENSTYTLTVDTLDEGNVSIQGAGDSVWVQSDGTNWNRFGGRDPRILFFEGPNATFNRASSATYLTEAPNSSGGFMASASTDELRNENWRKPGTRGLYLLEGAATQELADPDDLTSTWTANNGLSVSASAETPPLSGGTAYDLVLDAPSKFLEQNVSGLADNTDYTFTIWAKTTSGTLDFRLQFYNKAGNFAPDSPVRTATTTWQRFEVTHDTESGGTIPGFRIRADAAETGTLVVWMPNVTEGAYPTSTILTQSTRAADVLTFAWDDWSALRSQAWSFHFRPLFQEAEQGSESIAALLYWFDNGGGSNRNAIRFTNSALTQVGVTDGSSNVLNGAISGNDYDRLSGFDVAFDPTASSLDVDVDGADEIDDTAGAFSFPSSTTLEIAGASSGSRVGSGLYEEPVAA